MKKLLLATALSVVSSFSSANIGVSSMMLFLEDNKSTFQVTNTADYRQFIQMGISEMTIDENGEIKMVPYTRDNIQDWRLSVSPSRTIINKGKSKDVGLVFKPKNEEDTLRDRAYQLNVVPAVYLAEGEQLKSTVKMSISLAPYIIAPAKDDGELKYKVTRDQDSLTIKNNGRTYLRAKIDACPENKDDIKVKDCSKTVYGLSGRNLQVPLTDTYINTKELKITLSTHNRKFKDEFSILNGKTKTKS